MQLKKKKTNKSRREKSVSYRGEVAASVIYLRQLRGRNSKGVKTWNCLRVKRHRGQRVCVDALPCVCHCRTEIRPPPTQKHVCELESRPQSPLLTHDAIHQTETTGSHQQPTVYPDVHVSAPTASSAQTLSPEQAWRARACANLRVSDDHGCLSGLRAGRCCSLTAGVGPVIPGLPFSTW